MRPDEARAAGDEYSHSRSISIYSLTTIYSFIFRAKNNFPPPASADAEQRVARRAGVWLTAQQDVARVEDARRNFLSASSTRRCFRPPWFQTLHSRPHSVHDSALECQLLLRFNSTTSYSADD